MNYWYDMFFYYSENPYLKSLIVLLVTFFAVFITRKYMYQIVNTYIKNIFLKDKIFPLLEKPIFYTLTTQGTIIALQFLDLQEYIENIGVSLLNTFLLIIWVISFLKAIHIALNTFSNKKSIKIIRPQTAPLFKNLANTIIWIIAIFNIASLWGINMTGWIASAGIIGLAIGMAAKDSLANFLSGILILIDSPYKIGDYIVLENGERGKVTTIGLRSTRILTRDDVEMTIPNSLMQESHIKNESAGEHTYTRLRINISVAYGTDLDYAEEVLLEIANREPLIIKNPEPRLRWRSFGGSSMDAQFMAWISDPEQKGLASHTMIKKIYKEFAEKNIEIPYQKQELFIKEMPR